MKWFMSLALFGVGLLLASSSVHVRVVEVPGQDPTQCQWMTEKYDFDYNMVGIAALLIGVAYIILGEPRRTKTMTFDATTGKLTEG